MLDGKIIYQKIKKFLPFIFSFSIMLIYLAGIESMTNGSTDATDIMKTIRTWGTEDVYPSYVLYKGILSVYPYVWFYRAAIFLGINEFAFIKIYHCFLFSTATAIAFPYIFEKLLHKKISYLAIIIFSIVCFWQWESNLSLSQLMVDLPSLTLFLITICLIFLMKKKQSIGYMHCVLAGLLLGMIMGISGQYILAAFCIIIYFLCLLFKSKDRLSKKMILLLLLIFGILIPYGMNYYFEHSIVDAMREQGAWIPDGSSWLSIGYTRLSPYYRNTGGVAIMGNRKYSIFLEYFRNNALPDAYSTMLSGGYYALSIGEYLKIFFTYPADFLMSFINTLFLAVSTDNGNFSFFHLLVAYFLLYCTLCIIGKHNKCLKKYFKAELWIILSFLSASIIVVLFSLEPRYAMQLQGLIYATALFDDFIGTTLKKAYVFVKSKGIKKTFDYIFISKNFNKFLVFLLFMIACFVHMSTLYEIKGTDICELLKI